MIKDIEQLKIERPDLVESFEKMSKEDLLKQCYLESIDAINMEKRVALFMSKCTNNMSKTNYTLESLKSMINDRHEEDINFFCHDLCEGQMDEEILEEVKKRADQY